MKAQQSYTPPVPASIQDHRSDAIGNVNGRARNLPRIASRGVAFRMLTAPPARYQFGKRNTKLTSSCVSTGFPFSKVGR
jgi:hypothetical protein